MEKLDIFEGLHFEEAITKEEFHTYYPRVSNFKLNDEIRITVQNQDTYTLTSDSFIYIEGTFEPGTTGTGTCKLTNNAYAFLFEQIRYEINGVEVDRCTKPGITSALKAYVSYNEFESKSLEIAGWMTPNSTSQPTFSITSSKFNACLPLKFLLGFAEDYRKIVINACVQCSVLLYQHH